VNFVNNVNAATVDFRVEFGTGFALQKNLQEALLVIGALLLCFGGELVAFICHRDAAQGKESFRFEAGIHCLGSDGAC